jgi:hypothetical protein
MSAPEMTPSSSVAGTGLDDMGPVDYLLIEFPSTAKTTGAGLGLLLDLVRGGVIRVIDLEFVRLGPDGTLTRLAIEELAADDSELSLFAGASSGLLAGDDFDAAAAVLEPGTTAVILVYENLWAAPLARELRRAGAQLVAGGRIPIQALLAALDQAEAAG